MANFAPLDYGMLPAFPAAPLNRSTVNNGRVDIMSPMPSLAIHASSVPAAPRTNDDGAECTARRAISGIHSSTPLNTLFFSPDNINALQEGIRYRIYAESEGQFVIGLQNERELLIVMRSMYYQYGRNDPDNALQGVRDLNARVLAWCVPEVLNNLKQYEGYKRDVSTLPMPMPRSPIASMKGTRSLELTPLR